jgi:hypothetical protein
VYYQLVYWDLAVLQRRLIRVISRHVRFTQQKLGLGTVPVVRSIGITNRE